MAKGEFFCQEGQRFCWFGGGVTLRITLFLLEENIVQTDLEIITLGSQGFTKLHRENLNLGRKFTLKEIPAKSGDYYRLELVLEIDEEPPGNPYPLGDTAVWGMDESIHFLVHFVHGSLGDYDWNPAVSLLEAMNRLGKEDLNLYYSDKADLYLCPKRIPEGLWQSPTGFGVRPADNEIFILYNKERRAVGPGPINVLAFYKLWGYAPDFVVYGASGYHANPHFEAKMLLERGRLRPLPRFLRPIYSWGEELEAGLSQSASFIRFLIDSYGITRFRTFYERSWDLSLESGFDEIYGEDFSQLEKGWRSFLKQYVPTKSDLGLFAERLFFIRNYEQVLPYWKQMYRLHPDGYDISSKLATCYYSLGDYSKALKLYRNLKTLRNSSAQTAYMVGNALLQLGNLKSAAQEYLSAVALDSTYAPAHKKLGEIALFRGDLDVACEHLRLALGYTRETEFLSDIYFLWAECLEKTGGGPNPDSLRQLGLIFAKNKIGIDPGLALSYVYLAEAYLLSDSVQLALPLLEKAWELESKPYYSARILIDYGKAYDLLGERGRAKEYYRKAKKLPCGFLNGKTAQEYLRKPFKLSE
ncbi:MAG: hypothetical protein AMJ41_01915 [candidate division Zixibacteria bacterium DG_27]|nr:MAG: hypothetical protein AMJ41_01915 [candidate division Zixibacteria bacterium DG_27]